MVDGFELWHEGELVGPVGLVEFLDDALAVARGEKPDFVTPSVRFSELEGGCVRWLEDWLRLIESDDPKVSLDDVRDFIIHDRGNRRWLLIRGARYVMWGAGGCTFVLDSIEEVGALR